MKRYMDIIAGAAFLVLSAAVYAGSYSIRTFADTSYGVTFLPRVTAVIMAVVSTVVLVGGIRKYKQGVESGSFSVTPAVIYTCVLIFLYILLLALLGFVLSTIIYVTMQVYIMSDFSRKRLAFGFLLSLPFSFGVYYLFTRMIYIMLPPGILG